MSGLFPFMMPKQIWASFIPSENKISYQNLIMGFATFPNAKEIVKQHFVSLWRY